jgi:uncharacterized membrane protein|tara:strand:+ start:242 stop:439 length:198 start_codon:yes stop_codon:yes gene_type:complete
MSLLGKLGGEIVDEVFNDELQKEVVKALNDSVDIPFLSEKTEEKIMNAVYDTVEGVIKAALKKAL